MTRLLPRQRVFADALHRGLTGRQAALEAGYSPSRATRTASRLRRHPAIIEALERRRVGYTGMPPVTDDPRQWLLWAMADPEFLGMRDRIAVAAFLLASPA